jgi:hypothetical protein
MTHDKRRETEKKEREGMTKNLSSMVAIDPTNSIQMNCLEITSFQLSSSDQSVTVSRESQPESRTEGCSLAPQQTY